MNAFARQIIKAEVISDESGFEVGDIVEVNYYDRQGNVVDADACWADDECFICCQTWGTWNPLEIEDISPDALRIIGKVEDWRKPS